MKPMTANQPFVQHSNKGYLLIVMFISIVSCSGGGSSSDPSTGTASFGLSDAPVENAKKVVIEVDQMRFRREGESDIVIDRFSSDVLSLDDVDSFQIDLLKYQGGQQAVVIENVELPAGEYSHLILVILDEDVNNSYVLELDDSQREIKVPSDELKLGSFTVDPGGVQSFTVEFNLRKALAYRTGPVIYNLKPRGVSILDNKTAGSISGTVDDSLFNTVNPCANKNDATVGNVMYLYSGHNLATADLADMFDPDFIGHGAPDDAIEPFAGKTVTLNNNEWEYSFNFLPPGDYTLVFSCDAENDDPETYQGISLPLPADQWIELTVNNAEHISCDLAISNDSCAN